MPATNSSMQISMLASATMHLLGPGLLGPASLSPFSFCSLEQLLVVQMRLLQLKLRLGRAIEHSSVVNVLPDHEARSLTTMVNEESRKSTLKDGAREKKQFMNRRVRVVVVWKNMEST